MALARKRVAVLPALILLPLRKALKVGGRRFI
jgi:hypothetical protein